MDGAIWLYLLVGYAPIALLGFAPTCAVLASRRNRDAETWLLLGGAFGPLAVAWIALLPTRPRHNEAERAERNRRRTPGHRIPSGIARQAPTCQLCGQALLIGHACRPEVVEDRIKGRWTVRVGGQRIIGPL
jgi:hypothetical protein